MHSPSASRHEYNLSAKQSGMGHNNLAVMSVCLFFYCFTVAVVRCFAFCGLFCSFTFCCLDVSLIYFCFCCAFAYMHTSGFFVVDFIFSVVFIILIAHIYLCFYLFLSFAFFLFFFLFLVFCLFCWFAGLRFFFLFVLICFLDGSVPLCSILFCVFLYVPPARKFCVVVPASCGVFPALLCFRPVSCVRAVLLHVRSRPVLPSCRAYVSVPCRVCAC